MYLIEKELTRKLEKRTHELLHTLEAEKERILSDLSGVDKVTLTKLREIIADYYNAKAEISKLAELTFSVFEKQIGKAVSEHETEFSETLSKAVSESIESSSESIGSKVDEVFAEIKKDFSDDLSEIAVSTQTAFTNSVDELSANLREVYETQFTTDLERQTADFKQAVNDYLSTLDIHDLLEETVMGKVETLVETALTEAKNSGEFDGEDGKDGKDGKNYNLTSDDIIEISNIVISNMGGQPVFGFVDEDNNIILSGNFAEGEYSVKYEMNDGSTIDIGTLDLVSDEPVVTFGITNTLAHCTNSNNASVIEYGNSYNATITAVNGYELSTIVVTMGGEDITVSAVSGGNISITAVTGNIVITATATESIQLGEPVTVDIALTDGIRIGSDGSDRTQAGYCATEMIDLRTIPKPCTLHLTKAQWCSDGTTSAVRYYVANASGVTLNSGVTPIGDVTYFTVVANNGSWGDVTVEVTSANVGYIRFSGYWANTNYSDSSSMFTDAGTKATLTYTPYL